MSDSKQGGPSQHAAHIRRDFIASVDRPLKSAAKAFAQATDIIPLTKKQALLTELNVKETYFGFYDPKRNVLGYMADLTPEQVTAALHQAFEAKQSNDTTEQFDLTRF